MELWISLRALIQIFRIRSNWQWMERSTCLLSPSKALYSSIFSAGERESRWGWSIHMGIVQWSPFKVWREQENDEEPQILNDKKFEIFAVRSSFHIAKLQVCKKIEERKGEIRIQHIGNKAYSYNCGLSKNEKNRAILHESEMRNVKNVIRYERKNTGMSEWCKIVIMKKCWKVCKQWKFTFENNFH